MVSYIDATTVPLKNTGQIHLYGADAFEGMRKAGQLTARCLDALAEMVVPGMTTGRLTGSFLNSVLTMARFRRR